MSTTTITSTNNMTITSTPVINPEVNIHSILATEKKVTTSVSTLTLTVLNKSLDDPIIQVNYTHRYSLRDERSLKQAKQFLNQVHKHLVEAYETNGMSQEGLIVLNITSREVEKDKLQKIEDNYRCPNS